MKKRLRYFFELLYLLVLKDLKVRYKSSVLGYLWALANPFAFALVYYIAFKVIMRVNMPNYSIFLLTGMFPWLWLSNSLVQATGSYRNNASLVKRVNVERAVLPLGSIAHEMVHFGFALPVLIAFILFSGEGLYIQWVWQLPLMMGLQFAMVYPVALILALSNVFIHDVEYLIGICLSMLFFLTPIVYPLSMVPDELQVYFNLSPLTALIGNWRNMFLGGTIDSDLLMYCTIIAIVLGVLAIVVYKKVACKLGELL